MQKKHVFYISSLRKMGTDEVKENVEKAERRLQVKDGAQQKKAQGGPELSTNLLTPFPLLCPPIPPTWAPVRPSYNFMMQPAPLRLVPLHVLPLLPGNIQLPL